MAQAESTTTTKATGSARPRPQPPQFSDVERAHIRLITRLAMEKPHRIVGGLADKADLEERSEHLGRLLGAVIEYVGFLVDDTSENAPLGLIERKYLRGLLTDTAADIEGGIAKAAYAMAEDRQ
jgi:hypothetical protein